MCELAALVLSAAPVALAASRPDVVVRTIDTEAVCGCLVEFSLEQGLHLVSPEGADEIVIDAGNVVSIETMSQPDRTMTADTLFRLAGGDRFYGRIVGGDEDHIELETRTLGKVDVALDTVAAVLTPDARTPKWQSPVSELMQTDDDAFDAILLANGDRVNGLVLQIDAERLLIDVEGTEVSIDTPLIIAAFLAARPPARHDERGGIIHLADGCILTGLHITWSGPKLAARFGDRRYEVQAKWVKRIDLFGGRWEWLSMFAPISYQHTPMLSQAWDYQRDRNVLGGPMTVAGRRFNHGVGVHSQSFLTYDLKGRYTRFVTHLGIDDDSGPLADVTAEVRVDGEPRAVIDHIRRGGTLEPLSIDVTGANRLELIVYFGDNGDVQDRFNWAAAALIKSEPRP